MPGQFQRSPYGWKDLAGITPIDVGSPAPGIHTVHISGDGRSLAGRFVK